MAVKIGSLEIDLRANSAQFIQGMGRARGEISGFMGQFGKLQSLLIGGAGAAGFGAAIKGAVDFANNLGDLNTRLGFSTEFLSQMKFAAESSGVGFGTLTTSMQRFTRRLAEAQSGSGVLVDALEELGLDAEELISLGADEAFLAWADALSKVEDPGKRAALAMKGMDTEGVALTQVLAGGADAMREMTDEADRLGLTVSGETAAAATEFNFQIGKLTASGKGFVNQVTAQILPTLVKLVSGFTDTANGMETATRAGEILDTMLKGLLASGQIVGAVFQNVGRGLGAVAASLVAVTEGEFSRALSILQDFRQEATASVTDTIESVARITGAAQEAQNRFAAPATTAPVAAGVPGAASPAAGREAELGQRRALADAQRVQNQLMAEGARIFAATRTPAEELAATQERLNELLGLGAIDQNTFNRAVLESQGRFREATDAMKENQQAAVEFMDQHVALWEEQQAAIAKTQEDTQKALFGSLERGLQGLVQGTATARQAFASMTADILSQLARIAAQEAFSKLFPGSGSSAGGGGGGIGAFISTVVGGLFGAQNGASFSVGGSGGADSQVVAFRATPGERVSVGGGAGAPVTVVQNMSFASGPGDRETLDQVGFQAGEAIREAMARNG